MGESVQLSVTFRYRMSESLSQYDGTQATLTKTRGKSMSRTIWLMLLMLTVPTRISAQPMPYPSPPTPNPVILPNCALMLMGKANDIYYYATGTCPPTPTLGYGQSTTECLAFGCTGAMCNCQVRPALPDGKLREPGHCALSDCSALPADPQQKLTKIISECKTLEKYLKKVRKSPEITPSHKDRVQQWETYLGKLIPYLEDTIVGADPAQKKTDNYCTSNNSVEPRIRSVPEAYQEDEAAWSTPVVVFSGKTGHVPDESQTKTKLPGDAVPMTAGADSKFEPERTSTNKEICLEVEVKDLKDNTTTTVYFKPFTIRSTTNPNVYMQVGIQVLNPGSLAVRKATIADRNKFGHKLIFAGKPFLVSSVDDLSIAPDQAE